MRITGWICVFTLAVAACGGHGNEELKAEYENEAWKTLDQMIQDGARAVGTNFAHKYVDYLYPDGFGSD